MEIDITKKVKTIIYYSLPIFFIIVGILIFTIFKWNETKCLINVDNAKITSSLVNVNSPTDGILTELLVNEGDKVNAGQVIAKIKVITTAKQLEELQQAYDNAQTNYNNIEQEVKSSLSSQTTVVTSSSNIDIAQARVDTAYQQAQKMSKLYSIGAVSATQYAEAQDEYAKAQSDLTRSSMSKQVQSINNTPSKELSEKLASAQVQLNQAKITLEEAKSDENYIEITAPIAGIIYLTDFKQNTKLKQGDTIINIGNNKHLWVEAPLSQEEYAKVHVGQFVSYSVEDLTLTGTVVEIIHNEENDQISSVAKISFPDDMIEKVTPNAIVNVEITLDK